MEEKPGASLEPTPEQILYARILGIGMYVGLGCLLVTFALYVFGIIQPYIPHEELPGHWAKGVDEYLVEAEVEAGWGWIKMLQYGDFLNFIGIAILAGTTIFCYLAIIPRLIKNKDTIYVVIALLEVIVLVVAASGIIAVGH